MSESPLALKLREIYADGVKNPDWEQLATDVLEVVVHEATAASNDSGMVGRADLLISAYQNRIANQRVIIDRILHQLQTIAMVAGELDGMIDLSELDDQDKTLRPALRTYYSKHLPAQHTVLDPELLTRDTVQW